MAQNGLPLFPVTVVGSWMRPKYLLDALHKRQAGQSTYEEFNAVADRAVLEALKVQEDAGVDIVSDGEQRRDNFYSFVVEKIDGVKMMSLAEIMDLVEDKAAYEQILRKADAPAFAIHNPTVVGKLKLRAPLALDEYKFLRQHTDKPIKIPLPGPYLLTRSMWVEGVSNKAYDSQEEMAADIVEILRDELVALRDAGVNFVQFDEPVLTDVVFNRDVKERTFMCASMSASSGDPTKELLLATRMMNSIVEGVDGIKTGMHICRGNWSRKDEVLLKGSYEPLVPTMMGMDIDQLVLEYATPRAGELAAFSHYPKTKEIGLGVSNPRSDDVESVEFMVDKAKDALQFFDPKQIYLNPDCGFGTFAERPMNSNEIAAQKLQAIANARGANYAKATIDRMADQNILNGINLDEFNQALAAVGANPDAARGAKASRVRWINGLQFKAQIRNHTFLVDEPAHLTGEDTSPNSVEYILGAYGACLATGFVINATKRGITIYNLEVALTSTQNNVFNFLGLSDEGHPGLDVIKAKLYVQSDGEEPVLSEIWEHTINTSPVHNSLTRNVVIEPELQVFG